MINKFSLSDGDVLIFKNRGQNPCGIYTNYTDAQYFGFKEGNISEMNYTEYLIFLETVKAEKLAALEAEKAARLKALEAEKAEQLEANKTRCLTEGK